MMPRTFTEDERRETHALLDELCVIGGLNTMPALMNADKESYIADPQTLPQLRAEVNRLRADEIWRNNLIERTKTLRNDIANATDANQIITAVRREFPEIKSDTINRQASQFRAEALH